MHECCPGQKAPLLPSLTLWERSRASWGSRSLLARPHPRPGLRLEHRLQPHGRRGGPARPDSQTEGGHGSSVGSVPCRRGQAGRGDRAGRECQGSVTPSAQACPRGSVGHPGRATSCLPLGSSAQLVTLKRRSRSRGPYYLFQGSNPAQQAETGAAGRRGQSAGPASTPSPQPSQHPQHGHHHIRHPLNGCPSSTPFSKLLRTPRSPRQGACSGNPPPESQPSAARALPCRHHPCPLPLASRPGRAGPPQWSTGGPVIRRTPAACLESADHRRPARSQPWAWTWPWRMGDAHRATEEREGPTPPPLPSTPSP